ncbi:MAG: hypothetical protein ACI9NT_000689 [Bacteroidia bacterium]
MGLLIRAFYLACPLQVGQWICNSQRYAVRGIVPWRAYAQINWFLLNPLYQKETPTLEEDGGWFQRGPDGQLGVINDAIVYLWVLAVFAERKHDAIVYLWVLAVFAERKLDAIVCRWGLSVCTDRQITIQRTEG